MIRSLFTLFLTGLLIAPTAQAEGNYAGTFLGQVMVEEIDAEPINLGLLLGTSIGAGFGAEFLFSTTIDEDEVGGLDWSTSTYVALATYTLGGDLYLRGKVGYGLINLKAEAGSARDDEDESDFVYGVGGGIKFGSHGVELNYLVLPEFEDLGDLETDMVSIGYNYNF